MAKLSKIKVKDIKLKNPCDSYENITINDGVDVEKSFTIEEIANFPTTKYSDILWLIKEYNPEALLELTEILWQDYNKKSKSLSHVKNNPILPTKWSDPDHDEKVILFKIKNLSNHINNPQKLSQRLSEILRYLANNEGIDMKTVLQEALYFYDKGIKKKK